MARSGSPYSTPRDANRVPLLVAASTADGVTPVVLEADPTTHALVTSGSGGGGSGGTQYAELTTTSPATGNVFLGRYKLAAPTLTDGQLYAAQLDSAGNLKVNVTAGGTSGQQYADGTARGTATGTLLMVDDGTNIQSAIGTSAGVLKVDLSATTANATTIKVDGSAVTQPVSGTFFQATQPVSLAINTPTLQAGSTTAVTQATASNLNATVVGTGTFAVQTTLAAETTKVIGTVNQGTSPWVGNTSQINGVTVLMGNGVTGTGSQRVTIASDNTAFTVNAAQSGTWTNTVTQATAANLNATVVGTGTLAVQTTSETPGTGATNLGKAEDAAHTSGDTGVFVLAVRNDGAATSFTNANGDYNPPATDAQGRIYVVQKAPTATLSNVNSSATSVTILAANTGRIGAQFYNDSTQILYLKLGTTASATSFTVPLAAATYYELPGGYTGNIDGIWVSANGAVRVTELT